MYPRSTVDLALVLSSAGIFDRENAEICGVSVKAIRHWLAREQALPCEPNSAIVLPAL